MARLTKQELTYLREEAEGIRNGVRMEVIRYISSIEKAKTSKDESRAKHDLVDGMILYVKDWGRKILKEIAFEENNKPGLPGW